MCGGGGGGGLGKEEGMRVRRYKTSVLGIGKTQIDLVCVWHFGGGGGGGDCTSLESVRQKKSEALNVSKGEY